jgi:hypothetical protein
VQPAAADMYAATWRSLQKGRHECDQSKSDAHHCNNDEPAVALTSVVHGRNCSILLHRGEDVLIDVVVKVVVSQGDTTMTPLSWILMAIDVNAPDIDWLRWSALARLRPSNCGNTLVKGVAFQNVA